MNDNKAKRILMMALESAMNSNIWFESYQNETDEELKNLQWAACMEYEGESRAYLNCYELLTGCEKIFNLESAIREELEKIS